MKSFWSKLPKPFFALAPLADVTDAAFRRIIAKYGKPDIFWTEFTSADGLCSAEGRKALKQNLIFSAKEKPIVVQLFGANPEKMRQACALVAKMGFDGIDINMGCPERKIEKSGAGAALIKNPDLARKIIKAAISGANGLPVSVKTRLGYNKDELEKWLSIILKENVSAVTIHARTRKEMSDVPAKWNRVRDAVFIRDKLGSSALIIGNGDVRDLKDARQKIKETGADGIMFGRAIFGNPFLFAEQKGDSRFKIPRRKDYFLRGGQDSRTRLKIMVEHAKLFEKIFIKGSSSGVLRTPLKPFAVMKKHFKAYANGFPDAKELRVALMATNSVKEVGEIVNEFLKNNQK